MGRQGLERHVVDTAVYERTVQRFRDAHDPADLRRAHRPADDPGGMPAPARRRRTRRARPAQPLPRPLAQRGGPPRRRGRPGARRPAAVADRRRGPDRRRPRRPLPDDRRPQGPGGLRLPRPAPRHRRVRPDDPARDLAVHRQLLPRRRGDLADPGLPRRRRPARGDEPGALRLAGALGRRPGRHHPDAGHREQRQGDLRRLRRARARPGQRHPQPVLRVREPPRPLAGDRPGARARSSRRSADSQPGLRPPRSCRRPARPGTIGAGDWLKDRHGTKIVAVEALECPTMLSNGFGEHNIQGIGDKHIPLIHNVMNTDLVVDISDRATDRLLVLFNTDAGRAYLADRAGVPQDLIAALAVARHLLDLQHPRRDQDGEAAGPRPGRGGRDGRDRRRGDVPHRGGQDPAARLPGRLRRGRRRPRPSGGTCWAPATDDLLELTPRGARADLQPRLLHLGRAAGRPVRRLRRPPRPGLLARPAGAASRPGTP